MKSAQTLGVCDIARDWLFLCLCLNDDITNVRTGQPHSIKTFSILHFRIVNRHRWCALLAFSSFLCSSLHFHWDRFNRSFAISKNIACQKCFYTSISLHFHLHTAVESLGECIISLFEISLFHERLLDFGFGELANGALVYPPFARHSPLQKPCGRTYSPLDAVMSNFPRIIRIVLNT